MSLSKMRPNAWDAAVLLVELYNAGGIKADQALEQLPASFQGQQRSTCQSLFIGALRHGHRTQTASKTLFRKKPGAVLYAILLVAGFELLTASPDKYAKIVHHAVERSKGLVRRHEQGFLNAILRKLPTALASIDADKNPAAFYSHPTWLFERWVHHFGLLDTKKLLHWNQQIPGHHIRIYKQPDPDGTLPCGLEPCVWPGFFKISQSANWKNEIEPLLESPNAYIKDPSTRLAPALLGPIPGETVLDLCAAPGGKGFDLAHMMKFDGQLVSVDLPGYRIDRLEQNLATLASGGLNTRLIASDILDLSPGLLESEGLPQLYDAIMLDAPCTNTGVIQRRTDVKWRLRASDIEQCATLQSALLSRASTLVKPGGRIVYSTCSIEPEENREVIDNFLETTGGRSFIEDGQAISLPWETGHDGATAFRLLRIA